MADEPRRPRMLDLGAEFADLSAQLSRVAPSPRAISSPLFWRAGVILPFFHTMFFIQKPFQDGRKYPLQKENDTKSYQKYSPPTIVAAFSKKQTTATPQDDPISKQIKTSADPSDSKPTQFGFVLQSSLGGEVVTIDESHEP